VGVSPADAAGVEDLVEPLDDVGSLAVGELEASTGIAAQALGWEGGHEILHLILGQHLRTSLRELAGKRKRAAPWNGNGPSDECLPLIHLRDLTYSLLTGVHKDGVHGKSSR
jgi:hypothetical protein